MDFVALDAASDAVLAGLVGGGTAAPDYSTITTKLFSNDYAPTKDTVAGDLTTSAFDGYADFGITPPTGPFIDSTKGPYINCGLAEFVSTGSTHPEIAYGASLWDGAGHLLAAGRFTNPIPVSGTGVVIDVVPRLFLGLSGDSLIPE